MSIPIIQLGTHQRHLAVASWFLTKIPSRLPNKPYPHWGFEPPSHSLAIMRPTGLLMLKSCSSSLVSEWKCLERTKIPSPTTKQSYDTLTGVLNPCPTHLQSCAHWAPTLTSCSSFLVSEWMSLMLSHAYKEPKPQHYYQTTNMTSLGFWTPVPLTCNHAPHWAHNTDVLQQLLTFWMDESDALTCLERTKTPSLLPNKLTWPHWGFEPLSHSLAIMRPTGLPTLMSCSSSLVSVWKSLMLSHALNDTQTTIPTTKQAWIPPSSKLWFWTPVPLTCNVVPHWAPNAEVMQ